MSATITWTVTAMDCYPQADNQTDVVFTVHWTCSGVQDTYNASVYATCAVPAPTGGSFTPYADLTQDQVLGWIWANGVDQAATEAAVQQQIDNQINPPVVQPPLPWVAPTCTLISATKTGIHSAELHFTAPYSQVFAEVAYGGNTRTVELTATQGQGYLVATVSGLAVGTNLISIYATDGTNRTANSNTLAVVEIV